MFAMMLMFKRVELVIGRVSFFFFSFFFCFDCFFIPFFLNWVGVLKEREVFVCWLGKLSVRNWDLIYFELFGSLVRCRR